MRCIYMYENNRCNRKFFIENLYKGDELSLSSFRKQIVSEAKKRDIKGIYKKIKKELLAEMGMQTTRLEVAFLENLKTGERLGFSSYYKMECFLKEKLGTRWDRFPNIGVEYEFDNCRFVVKSING